MNVYRKLQTENEKLRAVLLSLSTLTNEQFEYPHLIAGTNYKPDCLLCLREGIQTVVEYVKKEVSQIL